ncbi:phage tail terminator protein [Microbacterium sp. 22242]|uniref:phage tail terminator protein n=1 Tax=Microbacterium sp. 22242 TaxID=3453896 RepID=UPI003F85EA87
MTDTLDLLDGVSAHMVSGVPGLAFNASGTYPTGVTGIFHMLMPATPDEVVVVTWVPQTEDPSLPQGVGVLQIRCRGAVNKPRRPIELLDQIAVLFLGKMTIPLTSTLQIMQVRDRVRASLGMDESKRWDWTDNYTLDVAYTPTAARPDGGNW